MEFLAQAEPLSLVMAAVWLFAAGMFPVGIMLGSSCSTCCGPDIPPCTQCTEGELPETLTVVLDNLPDQGQGPDLITLSFSSCFGDGVAGRVTAPGGDPATDKGAISAVELTDGGSGYAKLGRVAPTITISGGSGTGATFTPTVTSKQDACNVDYWELTSVAVSGGQDYVDGESLSVTVAEGDTEEQAAAATIYSERTQPTLTASAPDGSGAAFSISYTANGTTPETWTVSGVTVTAAGSGYADGDAVTFTLGNGDVLDVAAEATIQTVREEPTISLAVNTSGGSGASLTATLAESTYQDRAIWYVDSIAIDNGGSGYAVDDTLTASGASVDIEFYVYVSSVDGNGAITGLVISNSGAYYQDSGEVEGVVLSAGGTYYNAGSAWTVSVTSPGVYYREDASETPYVSTPTVTISQDSPSVGTGASITATVNSTPGDADFGKVTGLTIANGGSNYLAWQAINSKCCGEFYDGMSVVVKRPGVINGNCVYEHRLCGVGNLGRRKGLLSVSYHGPSEPPTAQLVSEYFPDGQSFEKSSICDTVFEASQNITDCSQWESVEFTAASGATATVTAGGTYESAFKAGECHICCKGEEATPEEVSVVLSGFTAGWNGTYVLTPQNTAIGTALLFSGGTAPYITAEVALCAGQTAGEFFDPGEPPLGSEGATDGACDTCHRKCRTIIRVLQSFGGAVNATFTSAGAFSPLDCSACTDTPLCSPEAGTYSDAGSGKQVVVE